MSAIKALKKAMKQKHIQQQELADKTDRKLQTVRNTFHRGNMTCAVIEQYADIVGCDVVLRDRETGEIFD